MKKNLMNFLCLGAIAFVSSIGFTACSDNDLDEPSANPTGEVANSDVKVNFVMNVEYGQSATTRMSANTVQWPSSAENTFRGIDNAKLLPYIGGSGATFLTDAAAASLTAARLFDLAKLYTTEADNTEYEDPDDGTTNRNKTTSSRRIIELPMPINSNLMLIYGKAIKGESTVKDMDAEEGKIVMNISDNASQTRISLVSRIEENEIPLYKKAERLAVFILNRVMHARVSERTDQTSYTFLASHPYSGFVRSGAYEWEYTGGANPAAMEWATLGAQYKTYIEDNGGIGSSGMTALEEALGAAYYKITKVGQPTEDTVNPGKFIPGEYRSGSSEAIARMLYDLYILCEKTYDATPTSNEEADAMRLAARIGHQIYGFYGVDKTNQVAKYRVIGNAEDALSIRGFIHSQLTQTIDNADPIVGVTDDDFTAANGKFTGLTDDILATYPACFGLPAGSAQMSYKVPDATTLPTNTDDEIIKEGNTVVEQFVFHFLNQPFVTDMTSATPSFKPWQYMYPAELAYFVNSPLRVSNVGVDGTNTDTLFPNGTNKWNDENSWPSSVWTTGAVHSTTASIAVQKNINYGVAVLKTTVSAADTSLPDNRSELTGDPTDADITVSGLRMTGILIGGQDSCVNWQYLPVNPDEATYVIYDNAVGTYNSTDKRYNGIQLNGTTPNYTIVFDNYTPGNSQKSVRFALEFRNGTEDFWGKDNLIRKDGTFYIQGEFTLGSADATNLVWDDYYQVPPLNQTTGVSTKVPRVFIQDHVTVANITLGQNALKQAVVSVPDLRTSSMSLGLSVDLTWTQGLTFNPVIGDN